MYLYLKLPVPIMGYKTVGEIAKAGCPLCFSMLRAEGSCSFGSLHCSEHGCVWVWVPSYKERPGYAPYAWKNKVTGKTSAAWKRRKHLGGE